MSENKSKPKESPNKGLPPGRPALSVSLIDTGRNMIETAFGDGAVAVLVVYETADKKCKMLSMPNLECVRAGLLSRAFAVDVMEE